LATFETRSPDQASIGHLLSRLAGEGRALVAEVSSLLAAEACWRATDFRAGAVLLAGALGVLLVGLAVASGAAVAALALALPLWAAALIVGVLELALALVLARLGLARLRRVSTPPEETLHVLEQGLRSLQAEAEASAAGRLAVSESAHTPSDRLGQPPS
jgi:putative superfamily III holin-X